MAESTDTLRMLKRLVRLFEKLDWSEEDIELVDESYKLRQQLQVTIREFGSKLGPLISVPQFPDLDGLDRFVRSIYGYGRLVDDPVTQAHYEADIETFSLKGKLAEFLGFLDERSRSILVLKFRLDGHPDHRSNAQVGEMFGISGGRVRQIELKCMARIRGTIRRRDQQARLADTGEEAIELMELSERPLVCLHRAGIKTITELTAKTEDDLLRIVNFGHKCLDEVKGKLAARGLNLMDG